tara:strand:- start:3067 stop:3633 length:567 start_codon:yes stop_codon:yes gene_type:complete
MQPIVIDAEFLRGYRNILIAGPQRSGTTLMSKYISKLLGEKYELVYMSYKANAYNEHDTKFFKRLIDDKNYYIIHSPSQCHVLHEVGVRDDTFIFFMMRDTADIIKSQERIGWTKREEPREKAKYSKFKCDLKNPISVIKYNIWNDIQKYMIPEKSYMEVNYESLSIATDLWVDKKDRVNFKPRQTEL